MSHAVKLSLLDLSNPRKMDLNQRRVVQYADQAMLKIKISSLGVLDQFIEIKKELLRQLTSLMIKEELGGKLRVLVEKIQPLGQLMQAKETAKIHMREMLLGLEEVQKGLSTNGPEKLADSIERLCELYRRLQKQGDQQAFDSTLLGPSLGTFYLTSEAIEKILPMKDGIVQRSFSEGSRPVSFYENIFWKIDPSAPYYELAFHLLGKIGFNVASAPSEFVVLCRKWAGETKSFSAQASLGVKGMGMHKILREYPDWISKIDKPHFGFTVIFHMVGNLQDAKPDNYIGILEKDKDGALTKLTPKGIDEDLCFAYPLCINRRKPTHFVNVRSFFFCLPQVYETIHTDVYSYFTGFNPAAVVLQWLKELWGANQKIVTFAQEGNYPAGKLRKMSMPILLLKEIPITIFKKMSKITDFLANCNANASYMDLFKVVAPELAYFYDFINKRNKNDPSKAFDEIFIAGGPEYEEVMRPLMSLPILSSQPLAKDLEQIKYGVDEYETLRDTLPEKAAEQFLEQFDFGLVSLEEQMQILEVMLQFPLEQITFRNCNALDDGSINRLIQNQPILKKLTLIGCKQVSKTALDVLAYVKPPHQLELVISGCPGINSGHLQAFEGYFQGVSYRDRRQTVLPTQDSELSTTLAERAIVKLLQCIEGFDWKQVQEQMKELTKQGLIARVKIKVIEKLVTSDLMRKIVQKNQSEALEFLKTLEIPLEQKNVWGETFLYLAVDENNMAMLKVLCSPSINWSLLKSEKISSLRLALEKSNLSAANILIDAGADLTEEYQGKSLLHVICELGLHDILKTFLEKAPQLADHVDKKIRVPLFNAIEFDHLECVKMLLPKMKSINRADEKGVTPLMFTAQLDRKEILTLLLNANADTNLTNSEDMTALQISALAGASHCFKTLLGEKPSAKTFEIRRKDGKNLLHLAVLSGKEECVKMLSDQKALLTQRDERGMTPGHYAAAAGHADILMHLVSKGFPIDYQDHPNKETPLMTALNSHQFKTADKLIQQGASLKVVNSKGFSVLHNAAKEGDVAQITYLCQTHLMDVNFINKVAPLHLASAGGHIAAIKLLVTTFKANVNAIDSDGRTPLHLVMLAGHEEASRVLVALGADVTKTMEDGWTCLHYAVNYTHPVLVEYLLSLQPNLINARTKVDGHTPLHKAMYQAYIPTSMSAEESKFKKLKQIEVVKILMRYGADIDAVDNFNYVPLHLAVKQGHSEFVLLLCGRGASIDIKNSNGRTPSEHGFYMADMEFDKEKKVAILEATKLLGNPQTSSQLKQKSSFFGQKFSSSSSLEPLEQQLLFLRRIKEDHGFRKESLSLARSLEDKISHDLDKTDTSNIWKELAAIITEWKLPPVPMKSDLDFDSFNTPEAILAKCLKEPVLDVFDASICLLPCVAKPADFMRVIKEALEASISPTNLKAITALIAYFQGHEALMALDFPKDLCSGITKLLGKPKKDNAKELAAKRVLDEPKTVFSAVRNISEWKLKQIDQKRNKLVSNLECIFDKKRTKEKMQLVEQMTFYFMGWHKEWFGQVKLRDFRPLFDSSLAFEASALTRLEETTKHLTGNCLIFLLSEAEVKRRSQCFEFVIEWMLSSLYYGDFHQAFALYQALTHPAILRMQNTWIKLKKLRPDSLKQWRRCEKIFLSSANYERYSSTLLKRLTPSIPAFTILSQQLSSKNKLAMRYLTIRQFQEHRALAQRLILPGADETSELLLFFTQELYPQESRYTSDKDNAFPGAAYAWEQSCKLEPPKI